MCCPSRSHANSDTPGTTPVAGVGIFLMPPASLRVTYSSAPEPFDRARKAIRRPSGDHAGAEAEAGGPLRTRWSRPSAFLRETCPTPAPLVLYAMRGPSADHAAPACVPAGPALPLT